MAARKPAASKARTKSRREPPEHLSDAASAIWRDVVERDALAPDVDDLMLETYCSLVARWREVTRKIDDEGLLVDGGEKRGAIVHPALATERSLAEQIAKWAPRVNRSSAARRPGPMRNATQKSIEASPDLQGDQFAGAVEGVLTLAWLIDEAQRAGIEALQKVSYVLIPVYLKGCADLHITPASLPPEARKKGKANGKVSQLTDAASARRARAQAS
jgi:phage terminase small subunit